ncbi:MAG: S41 family peptidase [Acidobacteria bacterium]|nr:S41 family peptidase [Acidobacteriota bacterium]
MLRLTSALVLFVCLGFGQTRIALEDRLWVASKIYASIPLYFAHWQGAPELDLDAAYKKYLAAAIAAETRWDFDFATLEFLALLKNGHTGFDDTFLAGAGGRPLGFAAKPVNGKWVVRESFIDSLKIGDQLERIDKYSLDAFFAAKRRYISASSDAAAQHVFFYHKHLFPQQFKLHLAGGAVVAIDRTTQKLRFPASPATEAKWLREPRIAYIRVDSFDGARFENFALDALKQYLAAEAIVIDVRGNTGGGTPERLLRALIERSYRNWSQSTAINMGLFRAFTRIPAMLPPGELTERQTGYYSAFTEYFTAPQFVAPGAIIQPSKPIYHGKVLVLTGTACASACEDFVMPMKHSGRATIVGSRTFGSSGQPFSHDFGNGMSFRISSLRMYFPDGSEFEGVGIRPDIEVQPSLADLRSGKDVVLDRALALAAPK